ncbi:MAG: hypothetical protein EHM35_04550, partial [Planctomycetaceae bacterium]
MNAPSLFLIHMTAGHPHRVNWEAVLFTFLFATIVISISVFGSLWSELERTKLGRDQAYEGWETTMRERRVAHIAREQCHVRNMRAQHEIQRLLNKTREYEAEAAARKALPPIMELYPYARHSFWGQLDDKCHAACSLPYPAPCPECTTSCQTCRHSPLLYDVMMAVSALGDAALYLVYTMVVRPQLAALHFILTLARVHC